MDLINKQKQEELTVNKLNKIKTDIDKISNDIEKISSGSDEGWEIANKIFGDYHNRKKWDIAHQLKRSK